MKRILRGMLGFCTLAAGTAHADIFHYNNVILGDRAIGLAGAYSGISDDASGVIYNPAGLAFASGGELSGSANAVFQKNLLYKDIFPGFDFEEKSNSLFPSFFGMVQKVDGLMDGLVLGFAMASPDSDMKDQNDQIERPSQGVSFFHRTVNARSSTALYSLAGARRIGSNLAFGLGVSVVRINELFQEFQHSLLVIPGKLSAAATAANKGPIFKAQTQNIYRSMNVWAVQPNLGMQWVVSSRWVVGLSVRIPVILHEELLNENDVTLAYRFADGTLVTDADLDDPELKERGVGSGKVGTLTPSQPKGRWKSSQPLKQLPGSVRGGLTWFASPRFLWALDVEHTLAAKEGALTSYHREAVTNAMTGAEYYVVPTVPVRLGLFTNFDSRPKLKAGQTNEQVDHVDFYGGSLFVSWAQLTSQFGAGLVYQLGMGESQKIAGSPTFQEVTGSILTFSISAAYQL